MLRFLTPIPKAQLFVLDWLQCLRKKEAVQPQEFLSAAREARNNWGRLTAQMGELARVGLRPELEQSVTKLFYEMDLDMLKRWAFLVIYTSPSIKSHEDLKTWCETLYLGHIAE